MNAKAERACHQSELTPSHRSSAKRTVASCPLPSRAFQFQQDLIQLVRDGLHLGLSGRVAHCEAQGRHILHRPGTVRVDAVIKIHLRHAVLDGSVQSRELVAEFGGNDGRVVRRFSGIVRHKNILVGRSCRSARMESPATRQRRPTTVPSARSQVARLCAMSLHGPGPAAPTARTRKSYCVPDTRPVAVALDFLPA